MFNVDNDTAGWSVSPTGNLVTTEGAMSATIKIALNTQPKANVVITFNSTDIGEGTVPNGPLDAYPLVITPDNWNTQEHTITVTGVDDTLTDGDQTYAIRIFTASDDRHYDLLQKRVSATNKDAPTIVWELPVTDGLISDIYDNTPVLLQVRQVGNEPIEKVRFKRYDWKLKVFVLIGEDATPPYQAYLYPADLPEPIPDDFNSRFNYIYANALDKTDPEVESLRKHIWIFRQGTDRVLLLPLVMYNYP